MEEGVGKWSTCEYLCEAILLAWGSWHLLCKHIHRGRGALVKTTSPLWVGGRFIPVESHYTRYGIQYHVRYLRRV